MGAVSQPPAFLGVPGTQRGGWTDNPKLSCRSMEAVRESSSRKVGIEVEGQTHREKRRRTESESIPGGRGGGEAE